MLSVVAVKQLDTFNDGLIKEIDFAQHWDEFGGPIFPPLRDPEFF